MPACQSLLKIKSTATVPADKSRLRSMNLYRNTRYKCLSVYFRDKTVEILFFIALSFAVNNCTLQMLKNDMATVFNFHVS